MSKNSTINQFANSKIRWHINSNKYTELVKERSIVSSKSFSQTGCSFNGTEIKPEKPDPGNAGGGRREKDTEGLLLKVFCVLKA